MSSDDVDRLVSVVPLLPPQAVQFLLTQTLPTQEMVVRQIASILGYLEANHVDLDPVEREFVLNAIVFSLSSLAVGFSHAVADMVGLSRQQHAAGQDGAQLHGDQGTRQPGTSGQHHGQR